MVQEQHSEGATLQGSFFLLPLKPLRRRASPHSMHVGLCTREASPQKNRSAASGRRVTRSETSVGLTYATAVVKKSHSGGEVNKRFQKGIMSPSLAALTTKAHATLSAWTPLLARLGRFITMTSSKQPRREPLLSCKTTRQVLSTYSFALSRQKARRIDWLTLCRRRTKKQGDNQAGEQQQTNKKKTLLKDRPDTLPSLRYRPFSI